MADGDLSPTAPRVLVVGAGFGGLQVAKALGNESARVVVCDRLNYHLFQPLLYQVAMAGLGATDVAVPIRSTLRKCSNVEVLLAEVTGFDLARRLVRMADGSEEPYDYLVVAAGARTSYFGHDEWAPFAPGLKDLDDAMEIRRRVLLAIESAERATSREERRRLMTFVVIGGGPTGVELAGAIADLSRDILSRDYRHVSHQHTKVVLLEMADRILTPFDRSLSARAADQLTELRVEVRTGVKVSGIDARGVWIGDELIDAATVLWGAGVRPSPLARALGVPLDRGGRVIVGPDCAIPGHPEVFVIGDMASFVPPGESQPLPGISPVAIQQGRAVARSILRDRRGEPRETFEYFDKGFMATIGRARAVAQLRKLRMSGLVAWLSWVFVHLWFLVGFRNRLVVFLNWIWQYLRQDYSARLITHGQPGPPGPSPNPGPVPPAPRPPAVSVRADGA